MKTIGKREPPRCQERQGLLEGSPARRQGRRGLLLVVPTLLAVLAALALSGAEPWRAVWFYVGVVTLVPIALHLAERAEGFLAYRWERRVHARD